jgi:intracellular sulfur oxidation DsrE/DsrF family protein
MKSAILLAFLLVSTKVIFAQNVPYNVVFDITSKDTNDHKTVLRWLKEISKGRPDAQMEVVLYGQSLDMVIKDKSIAKDAIQELMSNKNIFFKVCNASLTRHNIDKSTLLPGIAIVPDGIYEIITKQKEGWGYIKVAQ